VGILLLLLGLCGLMEGPPATAADRGDMSATVTGSDAGAAQSDAIATTITLHSAALGRETNYIAITPRRMEPGRAYPVLFLLHGAHGAYNNWIDRTPLLTIHDGRPLIVILPDGGRFGWYTDSATKPMDRYETFMTTDLIADVAARFPTVRGREGRGIAGLSMGGHGALSLAARHPELYSSASSLSGILHLENHADPVPHARQWHLNEAFGRYADNPEAWKEHSVYDLVDRFADADVALLFDTGTSDQTGAATDARQVDERLTNRAIVHTYREYPGAHNWAYWGDHVGEHFGFHLKNFEDRANGTPPETGQRIDDNKWHERYVDRALSFEKENEEKWSHPDSPRPLVLLGSSSVEHMALYKDFEDYAVANRGISADGIGLKSRGVLRRLYCSALDCRPQAVLILNGRNDLAGSAREGKPPIDDVVETYHEVVRRIRSGVPDAVILICACPPTSMKYEFMADTVPMFNGRLKAIAEEEGEQVVYVDTWTPFADEEGRLLGEFTSDGLHLNRKGHGALRGIVVKVLEEMGIEPVQAEPAAAPGH